ncbi:MAG: helix-turn-helix transcriptional regulator [Lysobacter sp.]|nr:helix-turn-helix transcriptional regulator [Lysobacter sp.]
MNLRYHPLRFAENLDLSTRGSDELHLVRACARGAQLELPAQWISFCLPLSGRLRCEGQDSSWEIEAGHAQIWREGPLRCSARQACGWLALVGSQAAWARYLRGPAGDERVGDGGADLFPWEGVAGRDLRRLTVRLARRTRDVEDDIEPLLEALCAALLDQQRDLHQRLQRCSGRTLRRRQQTLLRLLRVQHLIRRHPDARLDLARLARSASYSPCHLIRIYRDVFDETPTEYAARLRSDRAWRMVRETRMPVCEITEALGFESQSAFCRAFKHSFGLTATEARRMECAQSQAA